MVETVFSATPAVNSSLKWVLQVKDVGHLRNLWWNFLEGTIPFDKMAFALHVLIGVLILLSF